MVAFTPIVQADFSGTTFGGSPTWTDITQFVRLKVQPIQINKWRQDQLADVAPATMQLLLDNEDLPGDATAPNAGRFTPGLTTSPWYPHVLPGVRMRCGVTIAGNTYWLCDGYVDTWHASYDGGDHAVCAVSVSDIMAWFGTMDVLRSMMQETILIGGDSGPTIYLPLTDAAGVTAPALTVAPAGLTARVLNPITGGAIAFAGGPGPAAEGTQALKLTPVGSNQGYLIDVSGASARITMGSSKRYFRFNYTGSGGTGTSQDVLVLFDSSSLIAGGTSQAYMVAAISGATGQVVFSAADAGGVSYTIQGTKVITDGLPHDVVIEILSGFQVNIYVDGVLDTVSSGGGILNLASYRTTYTNLQVGGILNPNGTVGNLTSGTLSHVAVYSTTTLNLVPSDQYKAGATGFAGESTDAHVARLLTFRKNLGSALDAGVGTIGLHSIAGETLLQALLDTAKAEGGMVEGSGGTLSFINRARLRNPGTVATFDITAQQTTADLSFLADRQQLLNDVTITRPGGSAQRVYDQTSKNTFGTKALNEQRVLNSDPDALSAAGWLVGNGKNVLTRTPNLVVDLVSEPNSGQAAVVVGMAPMRKVTLQSPPSSAPAIDVYIQGSTITMGVDIFTCSFYTTAVPRPTLRFDATADSFTKLDSGNVFAW